MQITLRLEAGHLRAPGFVSASLSIDGIATFRTSLRADNCLDLLARFAVYMNWSEAQHRRTREALLKKLQKPSVKGLKKKSHCRPAGPIANPPNGLVN